MGTINRRDALLFALIFVVLILRLMSSPPIWHHGEAREALVVQGIVINQQWILPLRNGELPSKPPLFHWLAALPSLLVGVNDFTVRLPSVVGAGAMVIATFLLGRAAGGRRVGWIAAGALLGMSEFWDSATQARVDMVFGACIAVAIAGFFFWFREGNNGARVACYIATACSVLAKGPAGVVLIGLVIIGFLCVERRLRCLGALWSWPLIIFALFIDLGWYALAYQIGGAEFLEVQLVRENVDRALGTGEFARYYSPLVMLGWFLTRMLPWNLALPWALIRRLRGTREDPAGHLMHVWWISMMLIFAFAAGKRAVYLLPLYPAIAVLAARAIDEITVGWAEFSTTSWSSSGSGRRFSRRAAVAAIGAGIVAIDLVALILSNDIWRNVKFRNARLSVVEKIGAMAPADAALFATPEVEDSELMVIAYRLGREIERKMVMCAGENDYFLSPVDSDALPGVEKQIHLSSGSEYIYLIRASSEKTADDDPKCSRSEIASRRLP